jgi:hypothetical protein
MTDLEINKALALAIGWERDQIKEHNGWLYVADWPRKDNRKTLLLNSGLYPPPMLPWNRFDYRDWNVISPIAQRYGMNVCFKNNIAWTGSNSIGTRGKSPQQAIAFECIKRNRK